mmetsp:Transcript_80590/g.250082  ORF Transcript_80590/g.250082 Transcript_80590/m.250082 type:complete len:337 (-) Transcript_80590:804-1814(-)
MLKPGLHGHVLVIQVERERCHGVHGHREHTQGLGGVLIDDAQDLPLLGGGQRLGLPILAVPLLAQVQDVVGCPLTHGHILCPRSERQPAVAERGAARHVHGGEHHLSAGGEGHLHNSLVLLVHLLRAEADLASSHDDGCLRGIPLGLPLLILGLGVRNLRQCGVATQDRREEGRAHHHVGRSLPASWPRDRSHGWVEALARDVVGRAAGPHVHHGHLALRQSPGLVAADDRGRAERLHRRELPHEHVLLHHGLAAEGQGDRDAQGNALRDRSHRQGHRDEDHVDPSRVRRIVRVAGVYDEADEEDNDADTNGADPDARAQLLDACLQRRLIRRCVG